MRLHARKNVVNTWFDGGRYRFSTGFESQRLCSKTSRSLAVMALRHPGLDPKAERYFWSREGRPNATIGHRALGWRWVPVGLLALTSAFRPRQGPNFTVASGYDHRASGAVTVKGASAVPLQARMDLALARAQVSPERAGTSAMRGLGYALLAVGALLGFAGSRHPPQVPRAPPGHPLEPWQGWRVRSEARCPEVDAQRPPRHEGGGALPGEADGPDVPADRRL